jgi:hypothetical protein
MSVSDTPDAVPDRPIGRLDPSQVLRGLPAELFTLDAQGRIVEHRSESSADASTSEHRRGRTMREWCRGRGYPESVGERRQAAVERCLETGRPVSLEETWHSPLGGTRHSIQSYAPILGPAGAPEAVLVLSLAVPQEDRGRGAGSSGSSPDSADAERTALRAALRQAERIRESLEERLRKSTDPTRAGELPDAFLFRLPGFAQVRERVESLVSWTGPVLVSGEAGSGTSVVARMLHDQGRGGTGLPLALDCVDQTEEVEAALRRLTARVVHRDGAAGQPPTEPVWYTGLTLHGLEALSESSQRTLNEAIEALTAALRPPPGSDGWIRLVVTTASDLRARVADGRFRSDLAEALTGARIDVPPLRHRSEDLPLLAGRLLERASRRLGRSVEPLTMADLGRLSAYLWPGNLPELTTVIDRAVLTARDGRPTVALPEGGAASKAAERGGLGVPVYTEAEMRQRERDNLLEALRRTSWRIYGTGGAAELLGLPPTTLTSRIKKLGLARP